MSWVQDLLVRVRGDKTQLDSTLQGAEQKVSGFKTKILGLAAVISGAVVAAFALWKKAMESTEGTMDTLEKLQSTFKGGFQGLMRTIATGDWGGLIDNITKTAKAYRDLTAAQDQMQDIEASNVLKKSYLEKSLQAARIAAASAIDPALKAQYLQEAIDAQKAITDINVSEIKARVEAYEQSYKTLAGFDDEASALMIKNFRKIAGNYESFYGENGQLALLQIEKQSLAYKEQAGTLSQVEKAQYKQVRAAVANLEIFQEFRNNLKPEEFNEYIKTLGTWNDEIARGDQSLIRLTNSLTGVKGKLDEIQRITGPSKAETGFLNIGQLGPNIGTPDVLAPAPAVKKGESPYQDQWVESWKQATDEVTSMISDAFIGVFESIGKGSFEGFGDDLLSAFSNLLLSLGKLAISLGMVILGADEALASFSIPGALALIAAGAAALAIGGVMKGTASKGLRGGSSGGGSSYSSGSGTQTIKVQGVLRGKDIYLSGEAYSQTLNSFT